MSEETVEITNEDNIMFLQLAASLTPATFRNELDGAELFNGLDIIHEMGADIGIIWGSSLYVSMDDYFYRVDIAETGFVDAIFEALHDFSLWYLKNKTNGSTNQND